MEEALLSDKVFVMENGKIVEQGTAEHIFNKPAQPYTKQLIQASML